jgi:hypothetical protein
MAGIYEFSEEDIREIKQLGICSSVGAMQGPIVPSKGTEITFDAFVKEYEPQARYCARVFFDDENKWQWLAETWAGVDIDIVCDALTVSIPEDRETVLGKLFRW